MNNMSKRISSKRTGVEKLGRSPSHIHGHFKVIPTQLTVYAHTRIRSHLELRELPDELGRGRARTRRFPRSPTQFLAYLLRWCALALIA